MAAGAWKVFNRAKKYIGNGTLSLSSTTFRMCLATSASNLKTSGSARPLINKTSITGLVASTTGHPTIGKAMGGEVWTTGASARQIKFDTSDLIFTATASPILNIKYAVIFLTGASAGVQKLVCYSTLTTAQIATLAVGNTLTVQMASGGVLTLV